MTRCRMPALLAAPLLLLATVACAHDAPAVAGEAAATPAVFETRMALRDLWVEHVFWIRNYVLATAAGDAAQRQVAETEIVDNATALAATIVPFYGQDASDELLTLLAGHWNAVRDFDTATVRHSDAGRDQASKALTANAREIAGFLSGANPYLPEDAVFGLLAAHGAHHVAQIDQVTAGDFPLEAETWQTMRMHMLVIADAIAGALAQQFPDRFGG
jgi:hypothetical protein